MKKQLAASAVVLLTLACASDDGGPEPPMVVPQAVAPDPRIGEMQTAMTELLERIDVLNDRIGRLEEGASAPEMAEARVVEVPVTRSPAASAPAPAMRPVPVPASSSAEAVPVQRALVGAKIADDYRQAIILFGRGRHSDARRAFEGVYEADSAGDLADNALFWIGETYFAAGDFTNAMRFYNRVVNEYSEQNKAPDAMFKIALAYERTGDLALARKTLQQVIERYPYSSTASSAKAELQRIRF